ncbi:MAG: hypothetical protein ABH952_09010 [Candidatus Omnitrophota bacterium]
MHKKNKSTTKKNISGFTTIEFIVTLVILVLMLYPVYGFLQQAGLSWQFGENKTEVVQNARIALDKMSDEIKHAHQFFSVSSTQLRFWWKDLNKNAIADPDEILMYVWSGISGDDLTRKLDSEAQTTALANYVDRFELKYYDKIGQETLVTKEVYFITATITIKKTERGNSYTSVMRKAIHPRNI